MSISSINLDAFSGVVKYKSFSKASKALHITQSALSQRVLNLEDELGVTLFIRDTTGVRLTDAGEQLLQYTAVKEKMEADTLEYLQGGKGVGISGELRIGSLSSLTRSMLYPALDTLIRNNPRLHIEIYSRELSVLGPMSKRGEIDLIVSYGGVERQGWKSELIGYEYNVLCQSSKHKNIPDKYFDHDQVDSTTREFFNIQSKTPKILKRDFLHDIYHIIDAVELGWGKAVIPKHLIEKNKKLIILKGYKELKYPVYISYPELNYYPAPLKLGIEAILKIDLRNK